MDGNEALPGLVALALVVGSLSGCALGGPQPVEDCDPEEVAILESLPAYPGVTVDLHLTSDDTPRVPDDQDCVAVVTPPDAEAFRAHYEQAMRDAGWELRSPETGTAVGVRADGSAVSVALDTHDPGTTRVWLGVFPPGRIQP